MHGWSLLHGILASFSPEIPGIKWYSIWRSHPSIYRRLGLLCSLVPVNEEKNKWNIQFILGYSGNGYGFYVLTVCCHWTLHQERDQKSFCPSFRLYVPYKLPVCKWPSCHYLRNCFSVSWSCFALFFCLVYEHFSVPGFHSLQLNVYPEFFVV